MYLPQLGTLHGNFPYCALAEAEVVDRAMDGAYRAAQGELRVRFYVTDLT